MDTSDQDQPTAKRGGYRQRADGKPRENLTKVTSNRGGMHQPLRAPDAKAAARAMYEATPGATCALVAQESGIPEGTIRRWKAAGGWKSAARTIPNLAGRAGELANSFKLKMQDLGKPLSDEVAANEAAKELSTQHAVDIRAAVLDRHRKEWSAPRKLAYDAIAKANTNPAEAFERAKLAKITAETLQIVQVGECRAFGLDQTARGADGGTVVVVERTSAAQAQPDPVGTMTAEPGEVPMPGGDDGDEF